MSDQRQYWLFEAKGMSRGGHVTVTVRCGDRPYSRPLVGHLTMKPFEWTILREILERGKGPTTEAWGASREPLLEITDDKFEAVVSDD